MRSFTLIGLVAVAGCYSPAVPDCAYLCGNADACPAGLTCDTGNGMCRAHGLVGKACPGVTLDGPSIDAHVVDAPPDVPPDVPDAFAPDAFVGCHWQDVAINFPASVVESPTMVPQEWDVVADETFDTGAFGQTVVTQANGPDAKLRQATRFHVAPTATLTIVGPYPMIIAADLIDVEGTIIVTNGAFLAGGTTTPMFCDARPGNDRCEGGGGGGGGGYGGIGGAGGTTLGGLGGANTVGAPVTPLRGGCPGAKGGRGAKAGDPSPQPGGLGGNGGGALQLAARVQLSIRGTIDARGETGRYGTSDAAGGSACPGLLGRASGGGGGGGGGTIFVEGCEVVVDTTAKLCASGGGGGGGSGGQGGTSNRGFLGADGSCTGPAAGGAGEIADNAGGNGGFNITAAAAGNGAGRGGGGGGGAVGRIHVQQFQGAPTTLGSTMVPPANRTN